MMLSNGCSEIQVLDDIMVANEIFVRHGRRGGGTMLYLLRTLQLFMVKRGDAWRRSKAGYLSQDHLSLETAS